MPHSSLSLYRLLARLPWPTCYKGKLFTVAFLCVHAPLLALLGFVMLSATPWAQAWPGLLAALVATLVGTGFVLAALHALLAPVRLSSEAIGAYQRDGTLPSLPTEFTDEAGQLMARTQQTLTELHTLLQVRNRLLEILSHDVRTPLSTIQLAADLMTEELGQPSLDMAMLAELATAVHAAVQEASQLTTSLLDTARHESNLALHVEQVSTTQILTRLASNVRFLAQRKALDVHLEDHAKAILQVDRTKLAQVLSNFATNAIKFTPTGGQIRLIARLNSDVLTFEVHDTGAGFDAARAHGLFTAFDEQHSHGTEGEPGHGLGLWIAKTFAERLGGEVAAESVPGAGERVQRPLAPHRRGPGASPAPRGVSGTPDQPFTLVVLGDSLAAGYGLRFPGARCLPGAPAGRLRRTRLAHRRAQRGRERLHERGRSRPPRRGAAPAL